MVVGLRAKCINVPKTHNLLLNWACLQANAKDHSLHFQHFVLKFDSSSLMLHIVIYISLPFNILIFQPNFYFTNLILFISTLTLLTSFTSPEITVKSHLQTCTISEFLPFLIYLNACGPKREYNARVCIHRWWRCKLPIKPIQGCSLFTR